jgi:MinD superfamily P-loop ATPase
MKLAACRQTQQNLNGNPSMIISIASGKGGTGKTTVATNLAAALNENVQLLDCDVEEPNAFLFMPSQTTSQKSVTTAVPEIDRDKCNYCGKCEEICQFKAIAVLKGTAVMVFPELCHSCGGCMEVCPEGAVQEGTRELGTIENGRYNDVELVFGRLRVGEAMSPPLIKKVKTLAQPAKITIIDAPPGTSCPVIEAMKGTDFVVLVTEPTPFGLHDLKLAVGAVQMLNIPHGLIINRSDLGDDNVKRYAAEMGIPILLEIPFEKRIAEVYAGGKLIVEAIPEYKQKFKQLFRRISDIVNTAN